MDARFAKLPTWWLRQKTNFFPGGKNAGESIAGLKCLLALSLTMDFHTHESRQSLSKLEELTGLSRPMVIKGIRHLEQHGLVRAFRDEYANTYRVEEKFDDDKWGKIPYRSVKNELKSFLNRGVIPLAALKTYVFLLARRPNTESKFGVPYEAILEHTHGQRSHLRKALDLLIVHGLIRCDRPTDFRSQNNYTILGL
jgi:hypothetical protein